MGNLLCYDFEGKFIERHRLCPGYGVVKDNGGHWVVNRGTSRKNGEGNEADNRLFIYDSGFQYASEGVGFNSYLRGRRYSFTYNNCEFSTFRDTVGFLPVMENIVYKIVDGKVEPWYDIRFKGHEQVVLRCDMDKETTRRMLSDIRKARVPGRISKFQRINDHLLFTFNYEKLSEMSVLCCHDLQTGRNVMTKAFGDDHGLLAEPITYVYHDSAGNTDGHKGNLVLGLLEHTAFMASKNKYSNEVIDKIDAAIGDVAECNPILVFYTIKESME